jgi:hypothetical protein
MIEIATISLLVAASKGSRESDANKFHPSRAIRNVGVSVPHNKDANRFLAHSTKSSIVDGQAAEQTGIRKNCDL